MRDSLFCPTVKVTWHSPFEFSPVFLCAGGGAPLRRSLIKRLAKSEAMSNQCAEVEHYKLDRVFYMRDSLICPASEGMVL